MHVSIRELKSGLSAYLRQVRNGETLVITSRRKPVAKMTAYANAQHVDERLHRLLMMDGLEWDGHMPELPSKQPELDGQPAARAVLESRR